MNLSQVSKLTEDEAREAFEGIRWPQGPVCPHCGSVEALKLQGKTVRPGLYKCQGCEGQFTATIGTILEDSHLPIRTWLMAFAILCSSKKGVSALQLQRQLGLGSYRTAWHLCHRIRHAMSKEPLAGLLGAGGGVVEVDETYVGGKPRKGSNKPTKLGRATEKTPVVALIERGGRARTKIIAKPTKENLQAAILEMVDPSASIHTDEWRSYYGIGKHFAGGHHTVKHGQGEYARDGVHCNSAEGFFSLLKRGIVGSFHHISVKHMPRYLTEFSFRWDYRAMTDSERTVEAIKSSAGKRLMYRGPVSKV
jgi:transposase-like protein